MKWINVRYKKPKNVESHHGTAVLVYPPYEEGGVVTMHQAFYGGTSYGPNFYIFGKVFNPTHWLPIPEPPYKVVKDKEE